MAQFGYRIVDRNNRVADGRMTARDATSVAEALIAAGHVPLWIGNDDARAPIDSPTWRHLRREALSRREVGQLLLELRVLIRSGMDLNRALGFMTRAVRTATLKAILTGVHAEVQKGVSLSEALERSIPGLEPFIVATLSAGEASGQLDKVLERIGSHLERRARFRSELLEALVYPALLLVMAMVAVTIVVTVLIPQLRPLFEDAGAELPVVTRYVMAFCDGLTGYGLYGIGLVAFMVISVRTIARRDGGTAWDRLKLTSPFLLGGLRLRVETAMFSRLLAMLLESGIILDEAVSLCRNAATNRAFGVALEEAKQKLREGQRLSDALRESRLFPRLGLDLIRAGEEASALPHALNRTADLYDGEIEKAAKRLLALLTPSITLGLGLIIGIVIYSVLLALLSVNELVLQ